MPNPKLNVQLGLWLGLTMIGSSAPAVENEKTSSAKVPAFSAGTAPAPATSPAAVPTQTTPAVAAVIAPLTMTVPKSNSTSNPDALTQLVKLGLSNSNTIVAQQLRLEQVKNSRVTAFTDLLPVLSLSAGETRSKSESLDTDESKLITESKSKTMSLQASWTIWDNFQNIRNIQSAQLATDVERLNSHREVQNYILTLIEAFYDYQVLISRTEILENLLKQSQWTLEETKALVKAGAKTNLDSLDSEIQVLNTQRDFKESESSTRAAEKRIKLLLNAKMPLEIPRIDLLTHKPFFQTRLPKKQETTESNFEHYLATNTEYKLSRTQLDKSLGELRQTKLGYLPKTYVRITNDWNLDKYIQDDPGTRRTSLATTTLSLSLQWQFWDWLATPRAISNSDRDFQMLSMKHRDLTERIRSDLETNWDQYELNLNSVESSRLAVEKAEIQLEYSKELFRMGRINLLSMQQSMSRFFDAQISLANRIKTKYLLEAKIIYESGGNLEPDGSLQTWTQN